MEHYFKLQSISEMEDTGQRQIFKKNLFRQVPCLYFNFLWVLGLLGAGRGTWLPSLNYTRVPSLVLLPQGDERCPSALPPNPEQLFCEVAERAPVFLHKQNWNGAQAGISTVPQTVNVQSHYGLSFLPNIISP